MGDFIGLLNFHVLVFKDFWLIVLLIFFHKILTMRQTLITKINKEYFFFLTIIWINLASSFTDIIECINKRKKIFFHQVRNYYRCTS